MLQAEGTVCAKGLWGGIFSASRAVTVVWGC